MADPYTINLGSVLNSSAITASIFADTGKDASFSHRAPKPKGVKAVKATRSNIDSLAKLLGKVADQVVIETGVTLYEDGEAEHGAKTLTAYFDDVLTGTLIVNEGDWVIEEYDYARNVPTYRLATLKDRVKHDLR